MADDDARERLRNPGGTSGGMGEFLLGLALLVAGGYLFMDNVIVSTGGNGFAWGWFGGNRPFGITLIPLFIGIAFLFFNGRSAVGWLLTAGSAVVILVGIIANLSVQWRPTSLYYTVAILVLMAAGLGLIARAVRAH
jgi:hypothetical protein